MGTRDAIETPSAALEALPEPYNFASQTMLQVKRNCYNFLEKSREKFVINVTNIAKVAVKFATSSIHIIQT